MPRKPRQQANRLTVDSVTQWIADNNVPREILYPDDVDAVTPERVAALIADLDDATLYELHVRHQPYPNLSTLLDDVVELVERVGWDVQEVFPNILRTDPLCYTASQLAYAHERDVPQLRAELRHILSSQYGVHS
jgi:hypothetical protein